MTHVIVVGTSEPQDFQLRDRGIAIPGTGIVPTLEIFRYEDGVTSSVPSPPTVEWLDESIGQVRVEGVQSLEVGTYLVRFKLTDTGAGVGFVPNNAPSDVWQVVPIANR